MRNADRLSPRGESGRLRWSCRRPDCARRAPCVLPTRPRVDIKALAELGRVGALYLEEVEGGLGSQTVRASYQSLLAWFEIFRCFRLWLPRNEADHGAPCSVQHLRSQHRIAERHHTKLSRPHGARDQRDTVIMAAMKKELIFSPSGRCQMFNPMWCRRR
jgi:hypothetical protein